MLSAFLPVDSRLLYDLAFTPFSLSIVGLIVLVHVFAPFFPEAKHLAWVLSTFSGLTMSIVSLPFVWDYFLNGGSLKHVRALPELAFPATRFFQAYLICDLFVGSIYYRSHISLLAGWIHHPLYVLVVELTIRRSWPHLFCLCAVMEIPTFILGISTLFPRMRNNILFAVCFFTTRIVFHIVLGISLVLEENRSAVTGGSYIPATLLAFIFPLHVIWFVGCIKGFIFRAHRKTTPVSLTQVVALGPSPASPSIRSSSISFILTTPFRRLSHRHEAFEITLRSFQHRALELPTPKRKAISNAVSAYMPRREALYEWVGLGQKQRRRILTGD